MSATTDGLIRHSEFLAETEWLEAHLNDRSLIVLDCTTHLIPDPKTAYMIKSGRQDFERRFQEMDPRGAVGRKRPA
jgi:hypothetical protein